MTLSEAKTRALHIDPQLRAADWTLNHRTQVRLEVPVDGWLERPEVRQVRKLTLRLV
jgi:type I site-specific restriction endonuclease